MTRRSSARLAVPPPAFAVAFVVQSLPLSLTHTHRHNLHRVGVAGGAVGHLCGGSLCLTSHKHSCTHTPSSLSPPTQSLSCGGCRRSRWAPPASTCCLTSSANPSAPRALSLSPPSTTHPILLPLCCLSFLPPQGMTPTSLAKPSASPLSPASVVAFVVQPHSLSHTHKRTLSLSRPSLSLSASTLPLLCGLAQTVSPRLCQPHTILSPPQSHARLNSPASPPATPFSSLLLSVTLLCPLSQVRPKLHAGLCRSTRQRASRPSRSIPNRSPLLPPGMIPISCWTPPLNSAFSLLAMPCWPATSSSQSSTPPPAKPQR